MKSLPSLLTAFAFLLLLIGGYAGAYLRLTVHTEHLPRSNYAGFPQIIGFERYYVQPWRPPFFQPAAWVETKWRGIQVQLRYVDRAVIADYLQGESGES